VSSEDAGAHDTNGSDRPDASLACDELAVLVQRLRQLLESQAGGKAAFLSTADQVFTEFAETLDRAWTNIEGIAGELNN
jgi:hypothetical protein